ncbi:MAG TPA: copper chaperone PCu(A)C [Gammaproteobacteria bacterium]
MPFFNLIALTLLFQAAPTVETEPPLRVENAWVREAPPGVDVLAAYAVFCNDADAAVTLTNVISENFDAVQMHATVEADGGVTMKHLNSVVVEPTECIAFEPGGRHFMLMDPVRNFRAGDEIAFTLFLANGKEMEIVMPVRRADEMIEHHHEHH